MLIIAVIVGTILGAAWGEGFGAAAGAMLAWLLVRSYRQEQQIGALQQAMKVMQLQRGAAPAAAGEGATAPAAQAEADAQGAPLGERSPDLSGPQAAPSPAPHQGLQASGPSAALPSAATPPATAAAALAAAAAPAMRASGADGSADAGADAGEDALWNTQPGAIWEQPAATSTTATPARPGPLAALRQWLFGGNTIVKAGVGILFVGLAFLAKYASEQVQVPVELRLAGIAAVALVLLGLGWRLRLTRPGYAQVLQGGAVAVLYLTLFVAFRFYGVLAVGPVFGLMVLVAALAAALAVLQDSRALAVIGALGGFATPLLVSSGGGNQVALFAYYLVLDLGIAAVAWHKTWRSLNLIGFLFTFVVGGVWGLTRYNDAHYLSSQGFLIAYFLLFNAILLMPARQLRSDAPAPLRAEAWVNGSLLFGLPTITFALQHGLMRHAEYGTALSALVMAAFYVLMARFMRSRPQLAVTFDASLAIAIVFLTLVIPFALDARSTAGAWALEGAGLVWLGFRQSRGWPRAFGYALLVLSGGSLLWAHDHYGVPKAIFNAFFFNALMASAASVAAAYFVWRSMRAADGDTAWAATELYVDEGPAEPATLARAADSAASTELARPGALGTPAEPAAPIPSATPGSPASHGASAPSAASPRQGWRGAEALAEPLLIAWGTLWAVVAVSLQIDSFVKHPFTLAAVLGGVSAIALVFTLLSDRLVWPRIATPVMAHAPFLALGVLVSAVDQASPAAGGGWWAWPVALAVHLAGLWRAAPRWPAWAQRAVPALGVLVLAALGALQGRAFTETWGDYHSAWAWLGWLAVPALLLMLLPRPTTARRWPVSAVPSAYQATAAAVLTAGLLLWTLLANIVSNGSAQPLPYVPLLNPLDLGVGVALIAAWLWMRSEAAQPALRDLPRLPVAALGLTGFVWLNAMLIRAFHHFGGVPFRVDAWANSLAVQTGITLLWAATALVLMWLAARRALRVPWMVGAALLAAVVLKLLLVDLSGTGTVTRIVSFIGVGVLMLVIGYVAPLPSKENSHAAA